MALSTNENFRILILDNLIQEKTVDLKYASLNKYSLDFVRTSPEALQKINQSKKTLPYSLCILHLSKNNFAILAEIEKLDKQIHFLIIYDENETKLQTKKIRDNLLFIKDSSDEIVLLQNVTVLIAKWQLLKKKRDQSVQHENDIQERTKKLIYNATHDELSALPNRTMLLQELNRIIKVYKKEKNQFALFFLDLDRFKNINDTFTHVIGDKVLKIIARRLKELFAHKYFLSRTGGDEFAIIINPIKDSEDAGNFVRKILASFSEPVILNQREISVTASIGVAIYPNDGQNAELLFRSADDAMYKAKARGPNYFAFYEHDNRRNLIARLEFENTLFQAFNKNEFELHYQPEIDLKNKKIVGMEALLRWRHPTKGLISPSAFISTAEEIGLIQVIGEWVIQCACEQTKKWQRQGCPKIPVAVNVASLQFAQQNLIDIIKNTLRDTQLEAQYLEIELNENLIVRHESLVKTIKELKNIGVRLALDDFGVGNSSLSNLKKLPVDVIKIDASFIENIGHQVGDEVMIKAIIAIAKTLHLHVLAEGIETSGQLQFLQEERCDWGQGFYFSKPLEAGEMEKFLRSK